MQLKITNKIIPHAHREMVSVFLSNWAVFGYDELFPCNPEPTLIRLLHILNAVRFSSVWQEMWINLSVCNSNSFSLLWDIGFSYRIKLELNYRFYQNIWANFVITRKKNLFVFCQIEQAVWLYWGISSWSWTNPN